MPMTAIPNTAVAEASLSAISFRKSKKFMDAGTAFLAHIDFVGFRPVIGTLTMQAV